MDALALAKAHEEMSTIAKSIEARFEALTSHKATLDTSIAKVAEQINAVFMTKFFWKQVERFNLMYRLPNPAQPTPPSNEKLLHFREILLEEVTEVYAILDITDPLERVVALADWLGDLIIYNCTFAFQHGLPMPRILDGIMQSNFSKLGADGNPIYDARGKVEKGPNYEPPEPRLRRLLEPLMPNPQNN